MKKLILIFLVIGLMLSTSCEKDDKSTTTTTSSGSTTDCQTDENSAFYLAPLLGKRQRAIHIQIPMQSHRF